MGKFVRGDVLVINFPFSNFKLTKRRPVLVIKVPDGDDIIVAQITGSSYNSNVEISVNNKDFTKGNLKRESFVRIDKIASIEYSLVEYKIGSLKMESFNNILESICSFLRKA